MCFYYRFSLEAIQKRISYWKEQIEIRQKMKETNEVNGFIHPKAPIISSESPNEIQFYQWGLIPSWAKSDDIKKYTLNARIESLKEKPSFKGVINNRCLVLADGFYEWQWLDPKGKNKQKYLITLPKNRLFAFAGLWSEWIDKNTGEIIKTYTIVTTEANEQMAEIHNSKKRMPVVLTEENEKDWINKRPIVEFKNPEIVFETYKM